MPIEAKDEIIYLFPNFNGCAVDVLGMDKHILPNPLLGMWLLIHADT